MYRGIARKGPTSREAILMHAVARLVLHPLMTNIQTSWVKMGTRAPRCLDAGANDLGGTLMNESISRAAGTEHGQEMPPEEMDALIALDQPNTAAANNLVTAPPPADRRRAAYLAAPLAPVVQTPPRKVLAAE